MIKVFNKVFVFSTGKMITYFYSCVDLLLSVESCVKLHTFLYDKRLDFNLHITNFSYLSSNI